MESNLSLQLEHLLKPVLMCCFVAGRKAYPPSPYSFDKPQLERTIQQALKDDSDTRKVGSPPKWVQNINEKICKHTGEAPMFAESLLPSNKVCCNLIINFQLAINYTEYCSKWTK